MSFRSRRVRLVDRNEGLRSEDQRWLNTQGYRSLTELPSMALWYRKDGSSALGRTDPYHLNLYRSKGFTLAQPNVSPPKKEHVPWLAKRVINVVPSGESWVGTATELVRAIGFHKAELVSEATSVSRKLTTGSVANALNSSGIKITRGFRGHDRVLRLTRR